MSRYASLAIALLGLAPFARADEPARPPVAPDDRAGESTSAKQDSKDGPAPVDAELLRSLNKQIAPIDGEHPLLRVGSRMRDVQGRLDKTDAGDETRTLQKEIVQDLEKLIEQAKKQGGCPTCGAASCNKHGNQKRQTSDKGGAKQPQQPQNATQPNEGQVMAKPGNVSDEQKEGQQAIARAVWGHLPAKLKEEMEQAFKGGELPKYRDMIERYFRAVAEQNNSRK